MDCTSKTALRHANKPVVSENDNWRWGWKFHRLSPGNEMRVRIEGFARMGWVCSSCYIKPDTDTPIGTIAGEQIKVEILDRVTGFGV